MIRLFFSAFLIVFFTAGYGCATDDTLQSRSHSGAGIKKSKVLRAGYAIQFGAFGDLSNAERLTRKLNDRGIDAFYFRKDNGLYSVRFGDFATKAQAKRSADKLVKEKVISSYFISQPKDIPSLKPVVPEIRKLPMPEITGRKSDSELKGKDYSHFSSSSDSDKDMGFIAARTAERFVGIPYRWGGDNVVEGLDCSGFVRAVYNLCGVSIPRTSREQFEAGRNVGRSELKDGDLLFFGSSPEKINHVGIYVGSGKFVHAPKRGDDIKISSVDEDYFSKRFAGAKRYF